MSSSHALPNFSSDYQEGAHARVLEALVATNMEQTSGYGTDEHCERARDLIRQACAAPDADVYLAVPRRTPPSSTRSSCPGRASSPQHRPYQHARGRHRRARWPQNPRHPRRRRQDLRGRRRTHLLRVGGRRRARPHDRPGPRLYFPAHRVRHSLLPQGARGALRGVPQARPQALRRRRAPGLRAGLARQRRDAGGSGAPHRRLLHRRHQMAPSSARPW